MLLKHPALVLEGDLEAQLQRVTSADAGVPPRLAVAAIAAVDDVATIGAQHLEEVRLFEFCGCCPCLRLGTSEDC